MVKPLCFPPQTLKTLLLQSLLSWPAWTVAVTRGSTCSSAGISCKTAYRASLAAKKWSKRWVRKIRTATAGDRLLSPTTGAQPTAWTPGGSHPTRNRPASSPFPPEKTPGRQSPQPAGSTREGCGRALQAGQGSRSWQQGTAEMAPRKNALPCSISYSAACKLLCERYLGLGNSSGRHDNNKAIIFLNRIYYSLYFLFLK